MSGSVALVYPYLRTEAPNQQLFPPLGIASLASQLKELGIEVCQHDCTFRTSGEVVEEIAAQGAAIVGIYVMATLVRPALALLDMIREALPGALTVAGGPMSTLYPERFLERFDAVFCGEADISFPSFCQDYLEVRGAGGMGTLDLDRYPGLCCHRDGTLVKIPPRMVPEDEYDALPLPDRDGVDLRPYHEFWMRKTGMRAATLMTTRGCPHDCDFCSKPIFGDRFRKRSIGRVMEEVMDIARTGHDRIWIADDSFTLDLDHARSFCSAMIRSKLNMRWSCLSRVDSIDADLVGLMARAGCDKVYLGLESGSDETLRLMSKRTTVRDGVEAVRLFREGGIAVGGFFLVGYPGETVGSVEATFSLALSLPLDEISFNVPYPLPGSALFSRVQTLSPWDDWTIENDVRFLYRSEFDEKWLKRRISETLDEFARRRAPWMPAGPRPANSR